MRAVYPNRKTSWLSISQLVIVLLLTDTCLAQIPEIVGCFSSSEPLVNQGYFQYQSSGHCNIVCTRNNRLVFGLSNGTQCWCANELPRASDEVPGSNCDTPCQGFNQEDCGGGNDYWTVWLTELGADSNVPIPNYTGDDDNLPTSTGTPTTSTGTSSTGSPSTGTPTAGQTTSPSGSSQETDPGQLASGSGTTKGSSSGGSDETVAIAVGVIIGVVALALMLFVFWWTWRRRKRTGTFSRFQDSVDGSSSALKSGQPTQSPSPEMVDRGSTGPPIMVQRPTPGPASPTNSSALLATRAAMMNESRQRPVAPQEQSLNPAAAVSRVSRASSETDPFYTPHDQPPVPRINQSRLNNLNVETSRISHASAEEADDTLSPLEAIRRPDRRGSRFDFEFDDDNEYDGNESKGYDTGRHELA